MKLILIFVELKKKKKKYNHANNKNFTLIVHTVDFIINLQDIHI